MRGTRSCVATALLLGTVACESPAVVDPPSPSLSYLDGACQHPGNPYEGEIYGMIYTGPNTLLPEEGNCGGNYTVELEANRVKKGMWVLPGSGLRHGWMWEWTDVATDNCDGSDRVEEHAPHPVTQVETHCAVPGTRYAARFLRYMGTDTVRAFDFDYLREINIIPGVSGLLVTAPAGAAGLTDFLDAAISIDLQTVLPGVQSKYIDQAVLGIQNVFGNVQAGVPFSAQANAAGSGTDWFRFSAASSTVQSIYATASHGTADEKPLARLRFTWTNGLGETLEYATGYYAAFAYDPSNIVRSFRFADIYEQLELAPPIGQTRAHRVFLELLGQDRMPGEALHPAEWDSQTVTIAFDDCIDVESLKTWRYTEQTLSVGSHCSGMEHRWIIDGVATPWSLLTEHDFAGHAAAGLTPVSLEVRRSGPPESGSVTFDVKAARKVINGDASIADGNAHVYTATRLSNGNLLSGTWLVSYDGGADWQQVGTGSSIPFTWPYGHYTAVLRHEGIDGQGYLHRARLNVTVDSEEPLPIVVSIHGDSFVNDTKLHFYAAKDQFGNLVNGNWSVSIDGGSFDPTGQPGSSSMSYQFPTGEHRTAIVRHDSVINGEPHRVELYVDICTGCPPQ